MVREVTTTNFRKNLGEMLNQVVYLNDSIIVNKHGKPVAALVGGRLFARICCMRNRFDTLCNRIADASAEVPVEEGLAEIDMLVAQNRHTRR